MFLRKIGTLVAIASLGAALGACGASGSPAGQTSGKLKDLIVAMGAEPGSLNFLQTGDDAPEPFYYNVYEALTQMTLQGKVLPMLATSWETNGTTWTATMRKGVKWQNGATFTASDAAASINEEIKTGDTSAIGMVHAQAISSSELQVQTSTENPEMPQLISRIPIEPAKLLGGHALDRTMVGTGPYKFVKWDAGSDIVLARNDAYWGAQKAEFAKVTFFFRADTEARMAMLESGEADIAFDVSAEDAANVTKDYQVFSGPAGVVLYLRPNFAPGMPLEDPRLRQAIDMAIDRKSLLAGVFHGFADDAHGQNVNPAVLGYNSNLTEAPYDPAKAKELIKQAGAVGKTLTLLCCAAEDGAPELAQGIQQQLEAVGLKVKLENVDNATYRAGMSLFDGGAFTPANIKKSTDLVMNIQSNITYTAYGNLASFTCTGSTTGGCDQKYTALVNKSQTTPDISTRAQLYEQAAAQIQQDGLIFPIAQTRRLIVVRKSSGLSIQIPPGHKLLLDLVSEK